MSTIDAAPLSIVADGVTTSTVTVQVIDVNGNLHTTGGETVTLMTDLGSLGPVVDVGDGTYTSILKSATTAGTATIVGTVDGSAITDDAAVDFVPGLAAQLSITLQPGSPSRSGAAFSPQPAIQVEDAFGNAVSQSGVSITAAILTGGGTLGGTLSATTNASGLGFH